VTELGQLSSNSERSDSGVPTFRRRLLFLVIALALPFLGLAGVAIWYAYEGERDRANARLLGQTRVLALIIDRDFARIEALLQGLAVSRSLTRGDLDAFHEEAAAVSALEGNAQLTLIDSDGNEPLRIGAIGGERRASAESAASWRRVFTTGQAQVSDLLRSPEDRQFYITVSVPVFAPTAHSPQDAVYALMLAFRVDTLGMVLKEQQLPASWASSVLDRHDVRVARQPHPTEFIGQPAIPEVVAGLSTADTGIVQARTVDGIPSTIAFARAPSTGYATVIAAPDETFLRPLRQTLLRTFAVGAMLSAAGVAFALLMAQRMTRSLRRLADAATSGTVPPADSGGFREVDALAQALRLAWTERDKAAADQRAAAQALREANETLERRVEERTQMIAEANRQLRQEITRRETAETTLIQAQKMEAVGRLTGGIAHDFNNLLTTVIGNLDLLSSAAGDPARVRKLSAGALSAAERGAKLTAQLLAFGRRQVLRPQAVMVDHLCRSFESLLRRGVGEAIEIEFRADASLGPCHVDPGQLENALLNLALNARDAMPLGGRLVVEMHNATWPELFDSQGSPAGDGCIAVAVADTGHGMTPEVMERAFEPFFTTKQRGVGSGLGLSQVYGFVEQSGGHVTIHSQVGAGTTVTLYLPRAERIPAAQSGVDAAGVSRELRAARGSVLVAEDDADLLSMVAESLREKGYRVATAQSGAAAREILTKSAPFDLLISDVVMPGGVSGVDLAREAKGSGLALGVLLMSGYPGTELTNYGSPLTEFPFIAKPFRPHELLARVDDMIRPG